MSDTPHDLGGDTHIVSEDGHPAPPDRAAIRRFALPSLLGIATFLTPVKVDGNWTILMGLISDAGRDLVGARTGMPWVVFALLCISAAGTVYAKTLGRMRCTDGALFSRLFDVAPVWVALRLIGLVMGTMTMFQVGPEMFWGAATGGTVLYDLAVNIVPIFLFAGLLMPFLTDYGLMEFIGTLLKRIFRRLFTLPGRSAIDALASWMSSAPVGVLITIQQYVSGHYTAREAAVIATNFSVVSVPFALLVAKTVGMDSRFPEYYMAVVLTGVITAMIMPRIPPLSRFKDTPYDKLHPLRESRSSGDESLFQEALALASRRAAIALPLKQQFRVAAGHILDIWFGLVPAVIAVGGVGMIMATEIIPGTDRNLLEIITIPIVPLLEVFGLPETSKMAPALFSGFLDMFLPALIATTIDAEITRFVVGVMSVTQLIYMSEIGILMIKCEIPLRFSHLLAVFTLRTVIGLPIVVAFAKFVVF
ncbi:MAG: nucleoside recognition membrane protein YjiH [Woeseiaceae bacterium]|jgi:nucleoside recognition membrane protein YjiH